jgi:hypothetical protein
MTSQNKKTKDSPELLEIQVGITASAIANEFSWGLLRFFFFLADSLLKGSVFLSVTCKKTSEPLNGYLSSEWYKGEMLSARSCYLLFL